jgi:antitoxin component YwqK of YwqJK toxin-antitoxin module
MKYKLSLFLGLSALAIFAGCRDNDNNNNVVSKRYIHKYGYAVSKEEWETHNYPGQVVTNMRDGVTVTSTFEHGILHGPCTYTYPYSQTVETFILYNNGELIKEIHYDKQGMPLREEVRLSPSRYTLTTWYNSGTPLCIEEFSGDELVDGQYFTTLNETESRVNKGEGLRVRRDANGLLLSRDTIQKGYLVKQETFFPLGTPQTVTHYSNNKLDGQKQVFTETGEPLSLEEWKGGKLHGLATYFNNGVKVSEISYLNGQKNGIERHFVDGEILSQEICWENDQRHGPSTYYNQGNIRTEWFYNGSSISQRRFEENAKLDEMISQISPDALIR